jgi:hypothetical protein
MHNRLLSISKQILFLNSSQIINAKVNSHFDFDKLTCGINLK